ncbi:MAPK regulated corepressor interacting protein 2 [Ctenopharyngodon idella]|uniref:MAPK regulated corepressor interacting protein 2 n=1 Tax=Ctenopharyngodon idella TaxID=7959 RepID=UPI00222E62BE|nr:MAPK regulated corepressor interacting protein 2 [Ctenopharyngodon idella]
MMYTITRGPSKLVTQRRTGPTQQIESKANDLKQKQSPWLASDSPAPKIVFNRLNGKRYHRSTSPKAASTTEGFTPAHEENVRFVYEAWQEVEQKLGEGSQPENGKGPVQYAERSPNPGMKNFVPIDLEEWWAQRFLANIVNLS